MKYKLYKNVKNKNVDITGIEENVIFEDCERIIITALYTDRLFLRRCHQCIIAKSNIKSLYIVNSNYNTITGNRIYNISDNIWYKNRWWSELKTSHSHNNCLIGNIIYGFVIFFGDYNLDKNNKYEDNFKFPEAQFKKIAEQMTVNKMQDKIQ